jgi:hypothetical protein
MKGSKLFTRHEIDINKKTLLRLLVHIWLYLLLLFDKYRFTREDFVEEGAKYLIIITN